MSTPGQPADPRLSVLAPASPVRAGHVSDVLRLLRSEGPLTRAQLVRSAGLAWPTVMTVVASLQEAGLIAEAGVQAGADQRGGRPGALLRFDPSAVTALVAQVPAGRLQLTHVGADGAVIDRWERVADARDPKALIRGVVSRARRLSRTHTLGSVALTLPGLIDHRRGIVNFSSWGWHDMDVREKLRQELGLPVALLGPPAAAAVGEVAARWPEPLTDTVLIFLGGGLSAAVITGGRLTRGSTGAAGELGHTFADTGLPCRCGRTGCLETVAAGWAIREQVVGALGRPDLGEATLAELEALGDAQVSAVLDRAATALAEAVAWLVTMVEPTTVTVAATSFARGDEAFFESFRVSTRERAADAAQNFELLPGHADAVLFGTIHAALEQFPVALRPSLRIAG